MKKDDVIMQEEVKEVKKKKKAKTIRGLCITCNNASSCSFRASEEDRLIYFCELFDCFVEAEELVEAAKIILETQPLNTGNGKLKGLCINCKKCMTCTFTRPDAGTWHCEEYE